MDIITRLLIAAASSAAGALTGLFFSKRLKTRAAYYTALCDFTAHIASEVKFRKNPIKKIIADFCAANQTPLNKNLQEFAASADPQSPMLSKGVLKKTELAEIKQFLTSLGTLDSETQVFELEIHKEKFAQFAQKTTDNRTKFSSMYVKLGFLAGLALGIIIL